MADFRKWIYALAVVALLAGFTMPASAQIQCNTASGVPPTVRAEGYTELMGDLILNCSGGVPTGSGAAVPKVDIQIFLSTNVTSRLLTNSGVIFDEALLIFDEPNSPTNPNRPIFACGGNSVPTNASMSGGAPDVGPQGPGVCSIISDGNPSKTYDGTPGTVGGPGGTPFNLGSDNACVSGQAVTSNTAYGCGRPNVFEGRPALAFANGGQNNSVIWPGVPFDPPGTTTTRTIRITNVRGNAVGVGVSSTFTVSQIQMNISISGNNSLSINNPQQIVAFVQRGLNTTIARARLDFIQCNSENPDLYTVGTGGTVTGFSVPPYRGTSSSCVGSSTGIISGCGKESYNMAGGYNSGLNGIYPNGTGANNLVNGLAVPTDATPTVRFIEGFPTAWKMKNIAMLANASPIGIGTSSPGYLYGVNGLSSTLYPADQNQNVPGANYNTESGFENFGGSGSDPKPVNPPTGYASGINNVVTSLDNGYGFVSDSGHGLQHAGVADHGTRLALNFTNLPNGTNLWLPPVIYLYRQDKTLTSTGGPNGDPTAFVSGFSTGVMVLTTTDANGGGAYSATNSTSTALVQLTGSLAVYEILYTDPFSYEQADVPVVVAYNANLTQSLPQVGLNTQVAGGFAPFYTGAIASAASTFGSTPDVPRFIPASAPATLFTISACSCNLLFPFVANVGGFDTGIAVANASLDPGATFGFKGRPQVGTVQFWYYGSIPATGAPAPGPQTSNSVPAGQILTYVMSTGGGAIGAGPNGLDNRAAGFEGYIIAQAGFQYCHAYAFISAQGAGPTTNGTSEGYLGIVLDSPGLPRTNQIGENDAH